MKPRATEVIHLREVLAERFPGVRTLTEESPPKARESWPTGIRRFDQLLQGGLPRGGITELVSAKNGAGSALFLHLILRQARTARQLSALIDGQDSFDATTLPQRVLSRLLWVRCQAVDQAMKAADIILRDRNLPLVILDLKMNPATQTRKISPTSWYRLQRLTQPSGTILVVLTSRAMVGNADVRVTLESRFWSDSMVENEENLAAHLKFDLARGLAVEAQARMAG